MYAKLNMYNILVPAPQTFTTDDNRIITNFNSNVKLMLEYGFKELIDIRPTFGENQYIVMLGYTETEDSIIVNYEVKDKEPVEVKENLEDKVNRLEEENKVLKVELEEMSLSTTETIVDIDFRLMMIEMNK